MAWIERMPAGPRGPIADVLRELRNALTPVRDPEPRLAVVPVCRCSGQCHCGTLVPYLLHRQLELESEFYRDVH